VLSFSTRKVLIVGLGLIGGSLARALRSRHVVEEVVGYDLNRAECELGVTLGVIDRVAESLPAAVAEADLVVLAVPVKVMETVLDQVRPHLRPNTLLSDVGSTKGNIVAAARRQFERLPPGFVPGHPIAGTEKSGVAASDAEMFVRRKVILTPLPESSPEATLALARLWQAVGAEVLQMDVQRHDEVLAATSHLPHLLAFSLVDTLAQEAENTDIFRYAAGGFRDFTRIAASDPTMWHDICFANRDQLLAQIDRFTAGVGRLRAAIAAGDSQSLLGIFTRAKASREHFSRILARSAYSPDLHKHPLRFIVRAAGALSGRAEVPGDRSISHRAIMLAALADGISDIEGFLESEDSLATLQALRDLGVVIEGPHLGMVRVYGVGLHGLRRPAGALYLGGSGTSMRLLAGLLAAQPFDTELYGDDGLMCESMRSVIEPLCRIGADIQGAEDGRPPLRIRGGQTLHGVTAPLPLRSAQVKSALLLAGLYSQEPICMTQQTPTRDHTERMLASFGCAPVDDAGQLCVSAVSSLQAQRLRVPADWSMAANFIVAASITPGSEIRLQGVGVNPTRNGLLAVLTAMGADIQLLECREQGGEPVADLQIRYAPLRGGEFGPEHWTTMRDELPLLLVAAVAASGRTLLRFDAGSRYPSVERMVELLCALGARIERGAEGLAIEGGRLHAGCISCGGDYRVAMAATVAAAIAQGQIEVSACGSVAQVFPEFVEQARRLGIDIYKEEG